MKRVSDRQKERLKAYYKVRDTFMKAHPKCQWPTCNKAATDCHHSRGRAGSLISDERHFRALCREHHNLCSSEPNLARSVSMLCERGLWNSPDV
jgi:hypothetical protein